MDKEYPGRLIILGQEKTSGKALAVYAITGRSASSQARMMVMEGNAIWVRPTDRDLLETGNEDLLVYPSLYCLFQGIAISNGKQTEDIMTSMDQGESPAEVLVRALKDWDYEPDPPSFTPRISGCILQDNRGALSLIKKAPDGSSLRNIYSFSLSPGKGKMIMTYEGSNRDPLPSFVGEPKTVEFEGSTPQEVSEAVYRSLAPKKGRRDFRVAVACVFWVDTMSCKYDFHIINKTERM